MIDQALRNPAPSILRECSEGGRSTSEGGSRERRTKHQALPSLRFRIDFDTIMAFHRIDNIAQRGRFQGGSRQPPAAYPVPQGPIRQPRWLEQEEPAGTSGRYAERAGIGHPSPEGVEKPLKRAGSAIAGVGDPTLRPPSGMLVPKFYCQGKARGGPSLDHAARPGD